jgi:DNA-binding NarL/FixJ family response regulator
MDKKVTTILMADDHPLLLEGLVKQIESCNSYKLVGQATNGNQAWELHKKLAPDITILDIDMDGMDGIELTQKIKNKNLCSKVILLTMHNEPWVIYRAKNANPDGILLKNIHREQFIAAIESVINGKKYFSPEIEALVKEGVMLDSSLLSLTTRELEVLRLIACGVSTKEIADQLNISINTVETYRKNLFLKFNVANMAVLVKKAVELGIV